MKQLEITWTVTAQVAVPDDHDIDELRRNLAGRHRPSNHNPYGSESTIQRETFELSIVELPTSEQVEQDSHKCCQEEDDFPF